jgi:hypothetical protein
MTSKTNPADYGGFDNAYGGFENETREMYSRTDR